MKLPDECFDDEGTFYTKTNEHRGDKNISPTFHSLDLS